MAWPGAQSESGVNAFSLLWLSDDWRDADNIIKPLILGDLDTIESKESTFTARMKRFPSVDHVKPRWGEEYAYPKTLVGTLSGSGATFTVTGDILHQTATRELMLKVINEGGIISYRTGGVTSQARVTAVDPTNAILSLTAHGGTTMPSDGASQTWEVLGEPYSDTQDIDNPRSIDHYTRFTGSQIFSEMYEIGRTRSKQRMQFVNDPIEHDVKMLVRKMRRDAYRALFKMYPEISGGVPLTMLETEKPKLFGYMWWMGYLFGSGGEFESTDLYKDMGGASVLKDHWDELALNMHENDTDFNSGRWEITVHPRMRDYMHDYDITFREMGYDERTVGTFVDFINLKIGKKVPVFSDLECPLDVGILANMDNTGFTYFSGDEFTREEKMTGGRYRQWQLSMQPVGLIMKNPGVNHGMLYNAAYRGSA
jgi:hypothetical protein